MKKPYWLKNIIWFIQRGKSGYADCDFWNFDRYLTNIAIKGIQDIIYKGCHVGCGDFLEVLNDPEARVTRNLYVRILRFFELHKLIMKTPYYWNNKQLKRDYKASGLLFIRNFGRLWD